MTNVEGLAVVLGQETEGYQQLLSIAKQKRQLIVDRDLEGLEKATNEEQKLSEQLKSLEKQRVKILGTFTDDAETVPTVTDIVNALEEGSQERMRLQSARDGVIEIAGQMQFMNTQNQVLLQQALEMIDFDLTLFKSLRQAPESGNYGKDAYNTGDVLPSGGFDAKQ